MFKELKITVEERYRDKPLYDQDGISLGIHIEIDGKKFGEISERFKFFEQDLSEKILIKVTKVIVAKELIESFKDIEWNL